MGGVPGWAAPPVKTSVAHADWPPRTRPTFDLRPGSLPAIQEGDREGRGRGEVRASTLNVSITAGGAALRRGREPEPPRHVYLGAPPPLQPSLVGRIKKNMKTLICTRSQVYKAPVSF